MTIPERRNYNPDARTVIEYAYVTQSGTTQNKRRQGIEVSKFEGPFVPLETLIAGEWPSEPNHLAALNSHPFDSRIKFNQETHSYYVFYKHNDPIPSEFNLSASSWAKQQFPEFDEDTVIERMLKGRSSRMSNYKYKGMSREQIKDKWSTDRDKASRQGTFFHLLFECHCNSALDLARSKFGHLTPVQQYLRWRETYFDQYFTEFRTEIRFNSSDDLRIVGTADLLAVRRNHLPPDQTDGVLTISIFDWKNTKELKMDNMYEKGLRGGPCEEMANCNFSHYCIQQNIYAWLLTNYYTEWFWRNAKFTKVRVELLKLVIVHDNNPRNEAMMIDVPFLPHIIDDMVNRRRVHLAEKIAIHQRKQAEQHL